MFAHSLLRVFAVTSLDMEAQRDYVIYNIHDISYGKIKIDKIQSNLTRELLPEWSNYLILYIEEEGSIHPNHCYCSIPYQCLKS